MNFKRFISGVSAFAVASGAFAGMAISANAADTYDILYGTAIDDNGETTGVTPQTDFDGETAYTVPSEVTYKGKTFAEGTALNGKSGITTTFSEPAKTGKVYFSFTIGGMGGQSDLVQLVDSDGTILVGSYESLPNSGEATVAVIGGQPVKGTAYNPRNVYYEVTATVDIDMNTIDYEVVAPLSGSGGTVSSVGTVASGRADYKVKDVAGFKTKKLDYNIVIDHLSLYHVTPEIAVQTANYTVQYVDASNMTTELKNSVERTGVVGTTVSATEDDKADFDSDDKATRYSYNESESTDSVQLQAETENTITLAFDAHAKKSIPVKAEADGETIKEYASIDTYMDYDYSFGPYAYIEKDGVYYKYANINAENGSVPTVTGTVAAESEITLQYTKADDVVWYAEVDSSNHDNTHSPNSKPAANANASGGMDGGSIYSTGRCVISGFNADVAGNYKVTVNAVGSPRNSSGGAVDRTAYFSVDTTDSKSALELITCNSNVLLQKSYNVHLDKGAHNFYFLNNGGAGFYMDYIVVELVQADAEPITATLTSVESESYSTEEGYDENVTAAKLHVTVANGSAPIKVKYNGQEQTTGTSLSGDVVIGAILRGINAQVQQADFAVTVE